MPEDVRAQVVLKLTGDDRLRAEPLNHERERLLADLEHERRLATGLIDRAASPLRQQPRGGQCLGQGIALAGVERLVIDAGLAVRGASGRRLVHSEQSLTSVAGMHSSAR